MRPYAPNLLGATNPLILERNTEKEQGGENGKRGTPRRPKSKGVVHFTLVFLGGVVLKCSAIEGSQFPCGVGVALPKKAVHCANGLFLSNNRAA